MSAAESNNAVATLPISPTPDCTCTILTVRNPRKMRALHCSLASQLANRRTIEFLPHETSSAFRWPPIFSSSSVCGRAHRVHHANSAHLNADRANSGARSFKLQSALTIAFLLWFVSHAPTLLVVNLCPRLCAKLFSCAGHRSICHHPDDVGRRTAIVSNACTSRDSKCHPEPNAGRKRGICPSRWPAPPRDARGCLKANVNLLSISRCCISNKRLLPSECLALLGSLASLREVRSAM
jgi:hypothetical protein